MEKALLLVTIDSQSRLSGQLWILQQCHNFTSTVVDAVVCVVVVILNNVAIIRTLSFNLSPPARRILNSQDPRTRTHTLNCSWKYASNFYSLYSIHLVSFNDLHCQTDGSRENVVSIQTSDSHQPILFLHLQRMFCIISERFPIITS